MKRAFDLTLAIVAIVMLSPIMLVLALSVKITSGSPILFRQPRVGLGCELFELLKFRTMVHSPNEQGSWSTSINDSRITPIGRFLRSTSLDELPQLWNILVGDMSIVGPRPDVPQQRQLYTAEEWSKRTSVKPGLTGLAQCTLRSEATIEHRKELDLKYVREQSLRFDIYILGKTVKQVFLKGSY